MKQIHSLLAGLLLSGLLLTSCGGGAEPAVTAAQTEAQTESAAEETTEAAASEWHAAVPDSLDYDGTSFTILVYETGKLDTRLYLNAVFDNETGDTISDAIYRRCLAVEELLGADLRQIASNTAEATAQKAVMAGDDTYQLTLFALSMTKNLAQAGCLLNLPALPYIDVDAPWWDANFKDSMTIFGKLYFDTGDITVYDDMRVTCTYFNKGLWAQYGLDDPYRMVTDGVWTIDRFFELGSDYTFDLNGDGVLDQNDRWGILSEYSGPTDFYFGAMEHMATTDAGGIPTIRLTGERAATVAEQVLTHFLNESDVFLAERITGQSDIWAYASQMFMEDRALIRTSCFEGIPRDYRAMDTDFGVLPLPKYDEAQDTYYTDARYDIHVAAVPASVSDPEFVSAVTECLAAESKNILTPAFYEISLQGKVLRDNESEAMLDILFANKVYDMGYLYQIGSMNNIIFDLAKARSSDFQSTLASKLTAYQTALDTVISTYQELS